MVKQILLKKKIPKSASAKWFLSFGKFEFSKEDELYILWMNILLFPLGLKLELLYNVVALAAVW